MARPSDLLFVGGPLDGDTSPRNAGPLAVYQPTFLSPNVPVLTGWYRPEVRFWEDVYVWDPVAQSRGLSS